jgi:hypothetical protein
LDGNGFWLFGWRFQNGQRASPFVFLQDVRQFV